jgi:hypothetical protein
VPNTVGVTSREGATEEAASRRLRAATRPCDIRSSRARFLHALYRHGCECRPCEGDPTPREARPALPRSTGSDVAKLSLRISVVATGPASLSELLELSDDVDE